MPTLKSILQKLKTSFEGIGEVFSYNTRRKRNTIICCFISFILLIVGGVWIYYVYEDRKALLGVAYALIIGTFIYSLIIPFFLIKFRSKFMIAMILAILFSLGSLTVVGGTIHWIHTNDSNGTDLKFAFATITKGVFEGGNEDYVLLLTSKPDKKNDKGQLVLDDGFGVPLWVLFLSILGAAIYTISLLINGITHRPSYEALNRFFTEKIDVYENKIDKITPDDDVYTELVKFREMMKNIVQHQFYIFFAPFASIFVYQILVQADAATNPSFVGLVAIGSGFTINLLIKNGIRLAENNIQQSTNQSVRKDKEEYQQQKEANRGREEEAKG